MSWVQTVARFGKDWPTVRTWFVLAHRNLTFHLPLWMKCKDSGIGWLRFFIFQRDCTQMLFINWQSKLAVAMFLSYVDRSRIDWMIYGVYVIVCVVIWCSDFNWLPHQPTTLPRAMFGSKCCYKTGQCIMGCACMKWLVLVLFAILMDHTSTVFLGNQ